MSLLARVMKVLPFAAAMVLAGCGGGGDHAASGLASQRSAAEAPPASVPTSPAPGPSPTVPPSATPDVPPPVSAISAASRTLFLARAQQAACARQMNRVYFIDQQYAFLARSGDCADASYTYELFGATPDLPLCSKADSIAGPRTTCKDAVSKALFDTMVANLDKADLGLGAAHQVEQGYAAATDGSPVTYDIVAAAPFSGVRTARNLVIRDPASLSAVWAEHASLMSGPASTDHVAPKPSMPLLDFSTSMVIATFAGDTAACHQFGIRRVTRVGGRLVVALENRDISPLALCVAGVTAPMQMVVVDRSDAPVDFTPFHAERLPYERVGTGGLTSLHEPASQVVRDQAAWAALWQAHRPAEPAPALDFSRRMVLAYFLGARPNGCNGVQLDGIFRVAGRIEVNLVETVPGPGVLCTQAIVYPYILVALDRSDEPVVFVRQARQLL